MAPAFFGEKETYCSQPEGQVALLLENLRVSQACATPLGDVNSSGHPSSVFSLFAEQQLFVVAKGFLFRAAEGRRPPGPGILC